MTPRRRELPETGLPEEDLPDRALLERIWSILSRWAVPVMMSLAYVLLVATSDTDTLGTLLMATGLVLVLIGWFIFRRLTESAGLSRALSIGDVPRLLAIAEHSLPGARKPAARARLLVARALGQQLRGDHAGALTALDAIDAIDAGNAGPADRVPPDLQALAIVVRRAAMIELGRSSELRATANEPSSAPGAPAPSGSSPPSAPDGRGIADTRGAADTRGFGRPGAGAAIAWLGDGQLALAADDLDAAAASFARVIDDIRAGSAARAMAHLYAARIADTRGDSAESERHRASATALASPEASWLRGQPRP
ncbi:MAG TPA: hypothetical protein VLM79_31450 [Kofleriaceae bacterium]|nr:hypothetical protein [Kofleriaceae bacterium]